MQCIGSGCHAMFLSSLLGLRNKGPIDNVSLINGIIDIKYLFDNSLLDEIKNNEYENINECNPPEDNRFPQYTFKHYLFVHNDINLEKTKVEFFYRYNKFLIYLNEAKNNPELFFVYSINENDLLLSEEEKLIGLNYIPQFVKNRLIFVNPIYWLEKTYKISNYPVYESSTRLRNHFIDLRVNQLDKDQLIINEFNNWWKTNKCFYEDLNNCKYDLLW